MLVFPPLPSRLRYLIHNHVEELPELSTFSVGESRCRRVVVCHAELRCRIQIMCMQTAAVTGKLGACILSVFRVENVTSSRFYLELL